jgi:ribosomal-protein-alanine N-acetyltransferase
MGTFSIRAMEQFDIDAVLAIEALSFPSPWKREHFLHELQAGYSYPFVAVDCHGVLIGYLCLMVLFEEAQILDVAVAPAERGRGIAQALLEHAERLSRLNGADYIALEVRASNCAAQQLYKKNGYYQTGVRPRYYDGFEDAVLMEKRF